MNQVKRILLTGCAVAISAASLVGCSQERSPEAFCEVMDKHKERYEEATGGALAALDEGGASGFLEGTAGMISALGDLQLMWDELVDVSPDDIRPDVEVIQKDNEKQLDTAKEAMDDPLRAFAGSVTSGLMNRGSYTRVNDYAAEHCGSRPF